MKQKLFLIPVFLFLMGMIIILNGTYYKEETMDSNETMISLTIDGTGSENFPSKESGKTIESIECDGEAVGSWDYENWGPIIKNLSKNRTKCQFNFVSKYHETILNGTDPVLKEGLIPVTIEKDGVVKKAYEGREWYDYETQKWANAVILEDETKKYYEGDIIPEENIESYFVWIPKYRYKLWDLGNYTGLTSVQNKVQTIDVIFGEYDTVDKIGECKTPGVSGSSGNCKVGDYMTHPAFQSFGTKGIWVGKFEVGYKGATSTMEAQQNVYNSDKIEIKPNVYSWRNIQVANAHLNSYNYKREYDSHMMKNTEWGAVSYLHHSKYGSRSNIRVNNNINLTGYAAVKEPTCDYTLDNPDCNQYEETPINEDGTYTKRYNTEIGYLASTTKNITGIYDMSGLNWDYVMGMMLHSSGQPCAGDNSNATSGFSGPYCSTNGNAAGISFPDKKYYDSYLYGTGEEQFNNRILGDATGEMGSFGKIQRPYYNRGSWYEDSAIFLGIHSWFARGGCYAFGVGAGIFNFATSGGGTSWFSYRIVLAI